MRLCLIFVVALLLVASSCVDLTEPVPTQPECTANTDCDDGDICTTDDCSNSTCRNTCRLPFGHALPATDRRVRRNRVHERR